MGDKTGISWTDATWNPVRGCSRVSQGCVNCYAERVAARFSGEGMPYDGLVSISPRRQFEVDHATGEPTGNFRTANVARWNGTVRMVPEHLGDPLRWRKARRIFVNSMSDLFHENLTNEQIAAVFGVMAAARRHTFQVLTKRAARMHEWFSWAHDQGALQVCLREAYCWLAGGDKGEREADLLTAANSRGWPLSNVWLGVSVENQDAADRIPFLLETPAAVRFLSCEPLIGPLDIAEFLDPAAAPCGETENTLDWIIAGCESGPGARVCEVDWLRSLRDQCATASTPFFLKQAVHHIGGMMKGPIACLGCAVDEGDGSKRKGGDVIELPYLDGVQHVEFPVAKEV